MKTANRSNALLVELLIVVIFFMLASTVLLQVFTASRNQGQRAGAINDSLVAAQNTADRLYAAKDADAALTDMGFERQDDQWIRDDGDYVIAVASSREEKACGVLLKRDIMVTAGEDILFTLPCVKYVEVQP